MQQHWRWQSRTNKLYPCAPECLYTSQSFQTTDQYFAYELERPCPVFRVVWNLAADPSGNELPLPNVQLSVPLTCSPAYSTVMCGYLKKTVCEGGVVFIVHIWFPEVGAFLFFPEIINYLVYKIYYGTIEVTEIVAAAFSVLTAMLSKCFTY